MKISNDPFEIVIKAAENIYPGIKANIQFNPDIKFKKILFIKSGACGWTIFKDNEIPLIEISTNIPFEAMVETLAHELAHVICGPENGHSSEWESTFNKIQTEYNRLGKELIV